MRPEYQFLVSSFIVSLPQSTDRLELLRNLSERKDREGGPRLFECRLLSFSGYLLPLAGFHRLLGLTRLI